MTNSYTQIDTNTYNILDFIETSPNASNNSKSEDTSSFSNIINNLDARFQKAQNNFDKKAKVTNTSSINKKALNKKESTDKIKTQNAPKTEQTSKKEETASLNNSAEIKPKDSSTSQKIQPQKQDVETSEIQENENKKEALSDINNNSPVEPSPVVFFDEENILSKDEDITLQDAFEDINSALDEVSAILSDYNKNIQDDAENTAPKTEEISEDFESIGEIKEIVENISNLLDNPDLNQDEKDELKKNIDEIKKILDNSDTKTEDNPEFKELWANLANKLNSLKDDSNNQKSLQINQSENSEIVLDSADFDIDKKDDTKIQNDSFDKKENPIESVENLTKEIKDALDSLDFKKLEKIKEELPKLVEKIDFSKDFDVENSSDDFGAKLNDALNSLDKALNQTLDKAFEKGDFLSFEKVTFEDFKNIEITDKEALNQFLDFLGNIDMDKNLELDDNIKTQIEDLIKKISENKITQDELTLAVDELSKADIKVAHKNADSIQTSKENVISIQDKFLNVENKNYNSDDFSSEENFDDFEFDDFELKTKDKTVDIPDEEFDFDKKVTLKLKASTELKPENVENSKDNFSTKEIMKDIMLEAQYEEVIPSQSGALSVSDEVAKLALSEQNGPNSPMAFQANVTYDPVGVNAIIKNAMLSQKPQTVQNFDMNDILNQITNKFEQLKDSSGQRLTMVLRPNDLGRLSIELTSNQDGLTTQIMAQNQDVRNYIEKNINALRQQLSDAGVNVNSIQIKTAGQEGSSTYDGNQDLNKEQDENLNQQNNKNKNNEQKNDNKDAKEILSSISNYDMQFAKDFSNVLNKTFNYIN